MTLLRSLITVSLFLCFIALWVWAWRAERRADFAAAARLPLEGDAAADCRERSAPVPRGDAS